MYMPYTIHPKIPEIRMEAVRLVKYEGWSTRKAARHFGYDHSTIVRWCQRHPEYGYRGRLVIPTYSSRPHHHPKEIPEEIVKRILEMRKERNQCAEILHHRLIKEGLSISLSSVKRTLKRNCISRFSRWKKWHEYLPRPLAENPGYLVEIDSAWDGREKDRFCAYALIDVCSRWAYALVPERINSWWSYSFVKDAQQSAPFLFRTIQSDHGSEFAKQFTKMVEHQGISHRHSRVRKPTDNGHVERFIQTLQRECLNRVSRNLRSWRKEIPEYIRYYNYERPHMGLDYKTPIQVVRSY
jgi:transposase InsO family protein